MADNNQMIKKPEMGFFQRMRKNMLMRNINQAKYAKAPLALRNDMDVVGALLNADPNSAETLNTDLVMSVVGQENGLFQKLSEATQKTIVDSRPEYLAQMPNDQARAYVDKKGPDYIKYLSEQLQQSMLTEKIQAVNPYSYGIDLGSFSPSVVQRVVADFSNAAKEDGASQTSKEQHDLLVEKARISSMPIETQMQLVIEDKRFINSMSAEARSRAFIEKPELIRFSNDSSIGNIESLPIETQLRLAAMDKRVIASMSMEAKEQYIGNNPLMLKQFSKEFQIEYAKKHPDLVAMMDNDKKCEVIGVEEKRLAGFMAPQLDGNTTIEQFCTDVDMLKAGIIANGKVLDNGWLGNIRQEYYEDIDDIVEMTRFEPEFTSIPPASRKNISDETRLDFSMRINKIMAQLTDEIKAEFGQHSAKFQYGEERSDNAQEMSSDELAARIEAKYSELIADEAPELASISRCNGAMKSYIQEMVGIVGRTNEGFNKVKELEDLYRGACPTLNEKQRANLYAKVAEETQRSNEQVDERTAKFASSLLAEWQEAEATREFTQPIMNIYRQIIDDPKIIEALDGLTAEQLGTPNVSKVLFNPKVMGSVSRDTIIEYINNPQVSTLRGIVVTAYGEHADRFFEERPALSLDHIGNLDIFDSVIVEHFGVGAVHSALSYTADTKLAAMLGDLARNPQLMEKYQMYETMVGDYFGETALELDTKMQTFYSLKDIISQMSLEDLTEDRRRNLMIAINDRSRVDENNETRTISLTTLDDLDNYVQARNAMYDEYVSKAGNSVGDMREAIARRFFGVQYASGQMYSARHTELKSLPDCYNLEVFLSDERTLDSGDFSGDELDQLGLVGALSKVEDAEVLKEIYTNLSMSENVISPVDFKKTMEKVPLLYAREYVKSLLTVERAMERIQAGEEGISYERTEDGFDVIKLDGADFKMYIHDTGISASGNTFNPKMWTTLENGCSTISGSTIAPGKIKPTRTLERKRLELGFANIAPEQLIGMKNNDAGVSHAKRLIEPTVSSPSFDFPERHMERSSPDGVNQNEVVLLRRQAKITDIEEGTFGGRIIPDYIVARGQITEEHKKVARLIANDGKTLPIVLIDEKAYEEMARQQEVQETAIDEKTQGTVALAQENQEVKIQSKKVAPKAKNDDFEI